MKATIEIGQQVKVRILSFTSFRHYGGREVSTKANISNSILVAIQAGTQPYIVELLEDCDGLKKGHKIAITENDFNV